MLFLLNNNVSIKVIGFYFIVIFLLMFEFIFNFVNFDWVFLVYYL